jgi:hypothetical protein
MSERELLIEQVVTAWRERDGYGRIRDSPAWHDLDDSGRIEAFEQTVIARRIEAALDTEGLSATARAVLARIRSG